MVLEAWEVWAIGSPVANWKDIDTNSGILVAPNKQAGKMNY